MALTQHTDLSMTRKFRTCRLATMKVQRKGIVYINVVCGLTGRILAVFRTVKSATKFIKQLTSIGELITISGFFENVLDSGAMAEEMMKDGKTGCTWKHRN